MRPSLSILAALCAAASLSVRAQFKVESYDTPSYIEFSAPRFEVSATETNAVITVVRSGDYRKTASVEYSTQDGTAEGNVHFTPCGGTLVFDAGQSFKTINIPILRDQPVPARTFQVELAQPATAQVVVVTPSAEVEIQSAPPTLAIKADSSGITISWSDVGLPFQLQSQLDGAWSAVAGVPALLDGEWSVQLTAGAHVELFRLMGSN